MKNRSKITRVQLNLEAAEDYSLLGIVSSEPDYKLSLSLNRKLKLSLRNSKPIEFRDENGEDLHFSRFSDNTGASGFNVNLISNKSGNALLIRKLRKIDYILQILPVSGELNTAEMTLTLRNIDAVTGVFVLNTEEIRDKNFQYLIP